VGNAVVVAYDGKTATTQVNGYFELTEVPYGQYNLTCAAFVEGMLCAGSQVVALDQSFHRINPLELRPNDERFRTAEILLEFWGKDSEAWPWKDEISAPGPQYFELSVGPYAPSAALGSPIPLKYKWGGECRGEFTVTVNLLSDLSMAVVVKGNLYEGTNETNDDLDGQGLTMFTVAPGDTATGVLAVTNTAEDTPDTAQLTVSVKNARSAV
jgi:hypothetical protein